MDFNSSLISSRSATTGSTFGSSGSGAGSGATGSTPTSRMPARAGIGSYYADLSSMMSTAVGLNKKDVNSGLIRESAEDAQRQSMEYQKGKQFFDQQANANPENVASKQAAADAAAAYQQELRQMDATSDSSTGSLHRENGVGAKMEDIREHNIATKDKAIEAGNNATGMDMEAKSLYQQANTADVNEANKSIRNAQAQMLSKGAGGVDETAGATAEQNPGDNPGNKEEDDNNTDDSGAQEVDNTAGANAQKVINYFLGSSQGVLEEGSPEQNLANQLMGKYKSVKPIPQDQAKNYYNDNNQQGGRRDYDDAEGGASLWEGHWLAQDDEYGTAKDKAGLIKALREGRSGGDASVNLTEGKAVEQSKQMNITNAVSEDPVTGSPVKASV